MEQKKAMWVTKQIYKQRNENGDNQLQLRVYNMRASEACEPCEADVRGVRAMRGMRGKLNMKKKNSN